MAHPCFSRPFCGSCCGSAVRSWSSSCWPARWSMTCRCRCRCSGRQHQLLRLDRRRHRGRVGPARPDRKPTAAGTRHLVLNGRTAFSAHRSACALGIVQRALGLLVLASVGLRPVVKGMGADPPGLVRPERPACRPRPRCAPHRRGTSDRTGVWYFHDLIISLGSVSHGTRRSTGAVPAPWVRTTAYVSSSGCHAWE